MMDNTYYIVIIAVKRIIPITSKLTVPQRLVTLNVINSLEASYT